MSLRDRTIATVGTGVMAEAMIAGLLGGEQVTRERIIASHPRPERRAALEEKHGIRTVESNVEAVREADVVVTMGCGDECPYAPGKRYLDWDLEDPKGLPTDRVRAIRDDIAQRVEGLVKELPGPHARFGPAAAAAGARAWRHGDHGALWHPIILWRELSRRLVHAHGARVRALLR